MSPLLVLILAMIVYAGFSYIRRATARPDPKQERNALAEADRRLTEIEQEEDRA